RPGHAGDAGPAEARPAGLLPWPARPGRLRPGAELHRRGGAGRAARPARRAAGGAALRARRPGGPPADAAGAAVPGRPVVPGHLRRRPAGGAGAAVHRAGPAAAGAALPDRRLAVPAGVPVGREHLLRAAPAAGGTPGVLLLVAADAER